MVKLFREHPVIVVKVGGSEGIDYSIFCRDAAQVINSGKKLIVVHGGSNETNKLSEQLGHPPKFITSPSGHSSRRTDRRTLEIFQMAVRGKMNQTLVEHLQREGVNAIGISGLDGRLWTGERKEAVRAVEEGRTIIIRDDYTGAVEHVNTDLLHLVMNAGYTPVLSPPALSTKGDPINIDADRAAAKTAGAMKAETLLLLSNVPGLMKAFPDESTLIKQIPRHAIETYAEYAQGRMKKKVLGAEEALADGVGRVIIGDARGPNPVSRSLDGHGTVIQ